MSIPESNIEQPPQILNDNVSSRYVSGIGKMDEGKRTIILVNTDVLLEQEEIETLPGDDFLNSKANVKAEKTVESAERQFEHDEEMEELLDPATWI